MSSKVVTHSFNPSALDPGSRFHLLHEDEMSLAWAPDGRTLHYLHPDHHFRPPASSTWDDVPVHLNADASAHGGTRPQAAAPESSEGLTSPAAAYEDSSGAGRHAERIVSDERCRHSWADAELLGPAGEEPPGTRIVYALDATPSSRLRCSGVAAAAAANDDAATGHGLALNWVARKGCQEHSAQVSLWGEIVRGSTESCAMPHAQGSGAIALPLQGGATAMATGVSAQPASSLLQDERRGMMHLCGAAGLWRTRLR